MTRSLGPPPRLVPPEAPTAIGQAHATAEAAGARHALAAPPRLGSGRAAPVDEGMPPRGLQPAPRLATEPPHAGLLGPPPRLPTPAEDERWRLGLDGGSAAPMGLGNDGILILESVEVDGLAPRAAQGEAHFNPPDDDLSLDLSLDLSEKDIAELAERAGLPELAALPSPDDVGGPPR